MCQQNPQSSGRHECSAADWACRSKLFDSFEHARRRGFFPIDFLVGEIKNSSQPIAPGNPFEPSLENPRSCFPLLLCHEDVAKLDASDFNVKVICAWIIKGKAPSFSPCLFG